MVDYTPELADRILRRLEEESLRQICQDPEMPNRSSFLEWRDRVEGLRERYDRAVECRGEELAERALEAALTANDPQQGRLRWDALRWHAGKLAPKRWSDKSKVEVTGQVTLEAMVASTVAKPDAGWALPERPASSLIDGTASEDPAH